MDAASFESLSSDLRALVTTIPLRWGQIQNNRTDDKINMFQIDSYAELERRISQLNPDDQNYLKRRWYLWKCSQCDEYLFYCNNNVEKNPNQYDKLYDVEIHNYYRFDIKGTVIPQGMRQQAKNVIEHPEKMIDFYYDRQSYGRRYDIQNRLFIVHHSFYNEDREMLLRCAWKTKCDAYSFFCNNIEKIKLYKTHGVIAGIIFILEYSIGETEYKIYNF